MAFTISSRSNKPLFQSPCNFITSCRTTWLSAILVTVMVARVVISAPTTDVSSDNSGGTQQDLIDQVFNGNDILISLGNRINGTNLGIEDFQNASVSLRTVCNMYELYSHFTTLQMLSTVPLRDEFYDDYSSNLFVAWRVMQSACSWAKCTGSSLPSDCTLIGIANTCYSFNHRRLIYRDRLEIHGASGRFIPISAELWISKNEVPQHIAENIRNINL